MARFKVESNELPVSSRRVSWNVSSADQHPRHRKCAGDWSDAGAGYLLYRRPQRWPREPGGVTRDAAQWWPLYDGVCDVCGLTARGRRGGGVCLQGTCVSADCSQGSRVSAKQN